MRILKLNTVEDSAILHTKCQDVTVFDEELKQFCAELSDSMFAAGNGVGLAAPQVGKNVNIFVMRPMAGIENDTRDYRMLINPTIIRKSDTKVWEREGCLSIPGISGLVERHSEVDVKYQDVDGVEYEDTFSDFESRIVQHEYDHLNGVLFIYKARKLTSSKTAV